MLARRQARQARHHQSEERACCARGRELTNVGGQEVKRRTTKGRANGRHQLQRAPREAELGNERRARIAVREESLLWQCASMCPCRLSSATRLVCRGMRWPNPAVATSSQVSRSIAHRRLLPLHVSCSHCLLCPLSSVLLHAVALSPAIAVLLPLGSQRVTAVPNARGSLPDLNQPTNPHSNSTLYTPFRLVCLPWRLVLRCKDDSSTCSTFKQLIHHRRRRLSRQPSPETSIHSKCLFS